MEVGVSDEVTRPGQVRWFRGEGMPRHEQPGRGDLWVTYAVSFPKTLTPEQRAKAKEMLQGAPWHDEL